MIIVSTLMVVIAVIATTYGMTAYARSSSKVVPATAGASVTGAAGMAPAVYRANRRKTSKKALISGYLPGGPALVGLSGAHSSGVGFVAQQLAAAVVLKHSFWPDKEVRQGKVIYACMEELLPNLGLILGWADKLGVPRELVFESYSPWFIRPSDSIEEFCAAMRLMNDTIKADLIVINTSGVLDCIASGLYSLTSCACTQLKALSEDLGCTILIVRDRAEISPTYLRFLDSHISVARDIPEDELYLYHDYVRHGEPEDLLVLTLYDKNPVALERILSDPGCMFLESAYYDDVLSESFPARGCSPSDPGCHVDHDEGIPSA